MTTTKQFDQMWQRHTVVIGASEPAFHQSRERFGLLNVLGLAEENLELGSNHHVVLIFPSIQHVVAFHSQNVWQENRITISDSCVLTEGY